MFQTDDTIVAVSSPAGFAARAIIRLSGPDAIRLAGEFFSSSPDRLDRMPGFKHVDGIIQIPSAAIELPARAYLFRSPRSFTTQDVVELHLPGVPAAAGELVDAFIRAGARQANAGEFTARAFFAGRIDLSEAEAVADLINADDDAQLRSAMSALEGSVARLCDRAAKGIAQVLAGVEASIDFANEGISLDSPDALAGRLDSLSKDLRQTAHAAADMPETADRPTITLAGRSNVGKSALLNALAEQDRAIVSAMAGTTRDVLSAEMPLGPGASLRLLDAAGFLPADTPLEAAAHTAARDAISRADAIVLVTEANASAKQLAEDAQLLTDIRRANNRATLVLVANKCDLTSVAELGTIERAGGTKKLMTSALTGAGIRELRRVITETVNAGAGPSGMEMGLHLRQKRQMLSACRAAGEAASKLREVSDVADAAELIAVDLRHALEHLGQITGQTVNEDILSTIFSRFCVGK